MTSQFRNPFLFFFFFFRITTKDSVARKDASFRGERGFFLFDLKTKKKLAKQKNIHPHEFVRLCRGRGGDIYIYIFFGGGSWGTYSLAHR
jgi:hypothetical protein